MKLCVSHCDHKSIPDANFKSSSSSSFGDMMSQKLPRKKGMSHQIRLFTPGKRVQLEKNEFLCPESSRPKIDPHVNFSNFSNRGKFFHLQNLWDVLMRKEQQQPPPPDSSVLLKFGQNMS